MITAVIMAANFSRGMIKVSETEYKETEILENAIEMLDQAGCAHIMVVLGRQWEELGEFMWEMPVETLVNPNPEPGILASVKWALAQAPDSAEAFVFLPAQIVNVQKETIAALIEEFGRMGKGIIVPTFEGMKGHPILVAARLKSSLLDLPEDSNLSAFLHQQEQELKELPVEDSGILEQNNVLTKRA